MKREFDEETNKKKAKEEAVSVDIDATKNFHLGCFRSCGGRRS